MTSKPKKILIICLTVITVFAAGILCAAKIIERQLSDSGYLKDFLQQKYNLSFECNDLSVKFKGLNLYVTSPSILVKGQNSAPYLDVDNLSVGIKILPVIFKKISFKELRADYIKLNVSRRTDGSYDFSRFIKLSSSKTLDFDFSKADISIPYYNLTFNDLFVKNKYTLTGNSLISKGINKKKITLSAAGEFITENAKGKKIANYLFDIDVNSRGKKKFVKKHEILLSGLDTSFLTLYLSSKGVKKTNSIIDIYSTAIKKGGYKVCLYVDGLDTVFDYKGDKNTIYAKTPLVLDADIDFLGNDFILKDAKFKGENMNIDFNGKVKNLLAFKNVSPELKINVKDTYFKNIVSLLPDTVIPMQEQYFKNLKKYNANGIINGAVDVLVKGTDDYKVTGKLDFTDVYLVERPKNAPTSFGKCEFKGKDVIIEVYANAPNDAAITVFGKTQMTRLPVGEFAIRSFGKIDMAFAQGILNPLQKILALKLGPLPYMKLKGNGEIVLHTQGTKVKSKLNGKFTTKDATVSMQGINAILTHGAVDVVFNGDKILFNGATGLIDGAKTNIDGEADTLGNMSLDVKVQNVSAAKAMQIAKTSKFVTDALDGGAFLESFKPVLGNLDFMMNLSGNIPPDAVFGEQTDSVATKGKIIFKGVDLIVAPKIKGENLRGVLNFSNTTNFDLTANIYKSPFKIKGQVYQKGARNKVLHGVPSTLKIQFISDKVASNSIGNFITENIELFAPINRMFALNLAKVFNSNKFNVQGNIDAQGLINPNTTVLDLSGFNFKGKVQGINEKGADCSFKSGNITLSGKDVKFNNLRLLLSNVDFLIDGTISKFASLKPYNDLKIVFYNSRLEAYMNLLKKASPEKIRKTLDNLANFTGTIQGYMKLKGTKISGELVPHNAALTDVKGSSRADLKSGKILFKNNKTYLNAFNLLYDELPLYVDGFIQSDGDPNPEFNFYISTNLTEKSVDKLINPYLQYPLLLTGEATLKGRLQGRLNSYETYLTAVVNEGSDLSFMGLKLGDIQNKREFASKIKFRGNVAYIDYIRYFKYILSQNNKQSVYDLIKISGGVSVKNNDYVLNNLKFVTPNPAPVRFLNPLFKKSIIKDGQFTSNLTLNGAMKDINATGKLSFSNVFVPLYNSTVENIDINLNKKTGTAQFKLTAFDTTGDFIINFVNKTALPIVINDITVHSASVSMESLMKIFSKFAEETSKANTESAQTNNSQMIVIKPSDILIKKGTASADKVLLNGVEAQNFKMNFSHSKEAVLKIDSLYMAIADGLIKGSGIYKFDTSDISAESVFIDCDINELTKAFFNLSGQIYGYANGNFSISMKNFTPDDYVDKINANGEFVILNGRMPKLGSIEYLLRASNILKSGVFGLTLNNVLQLLTPYKHGDFAKISGTFKVKNASIQDLKILSQGENLSTYTFGSYDIAHGTANIEILGKLSKKISNLLGPIGNTSIVSMLNILTKDKVDTVMRNEMMKNINKIPLIDLNNDDYRLFTVKLKGAISTEDVVKSFNWLN